MRCYYVKIIFIDILKKSMYYVIIKYVTIKPMMIFVKDEVYT